MDLNEYQEKAARTAGGFSSLEDMGQMAMAGMVEEAGECVGCLKKMRWHSDPRAKDRLLLELGDLLWYVATFFTAHGLKLGDTQWYPTVGLVNKKADGQDMEHAMNLVVLALRLCSATTRQDRMMGGWAMMSEIGMVGCLFGYTIESITAANLEKLGRRFKEGFSPEAAQAQADTVSL